MTDFELGRIMYQKAESFINDRYPFGWGGCAVMYTEEGHFLTSVYFDSPNSAACLCIETGAMCEAQKYNLKITHSLCVTREDETEKLTILTPCGICQERLRYWGDDVKVAISNDENNIVFKTLNEISIHYWRKALID